MNPDLRVLLAVGVIGSEPFLPMIRNDNTRRVWIKNAVNYLRKYEFDGLHMDWEFPGDSGSSSEDKYRLSNLLKVCILRIVCASRTLNKVMLYLKF